MPDAIAQFSQAKYLNLETFRKSGVGVRTPVWFAPDGPVFYVYTAPDAGKIKRIRNNPKVRVAPCTFRGEPRGAWIEARALLCSCEEAARGQALLRRKYGWMKIVGDFFSRLRGRKQAVIAIHMD
jgi:uncharacterized protein